MTTLVPVLLPLLSFPSAAATREYHVVTPAASAATSTSPATSALSFTLPYSLGTHDGRASEIQGTLSIDPEKPSATTGTLRVPIASITTDNAARDCHLREALGLDYAVSDYPKEHVCGKDEQVPSSGKNSIQHSFVDLKIESLKILEETGKVLPDRETSIELTGTWSIHGVNRPARLALTVSPEGEKFRVRGNSRLSLKSHGVEVKPAKILFATIRVEDEATVTFNLLLQPKK